SQNNHSMGAAFTTKRYSTNHNGTVRTRIEGPMYWLVTPSLKTSPARLGPVTELSKANLLRAEAGATHLCAIGGDGVYDPLHVSFDDGASGATAVVQDTRGNERSTHRRRIL